MQVTVRHRDFETGAQKLVAIVQAPSELDLNGQLEFAWVKTQNIDGSWSYGPTLPGGERNPDFSDAVRVIAPLPELNGRRYGHRSSMVGDHFTLGAAVYRCAQIGFEKVIGQ